MGLLKKLRVSHVILLALIPILGYLVWSRLPTRMGGISSELQSEFDSEGEWLMTEIIADVAEMSLAATHGAEALEGLHVELEKLDDGSGSAPRWEASISLPAGGVSLSQTLVPPPHLWSPRAYVELANELLPEGSSVQEAGEEDETLLKTLLRPTDGAMAKDDVRISRLLAEDLMNASAHEEAALLLSTLALREAAGTFTDLRLVFCRITSHLAIASALRAPHELGVPGRVANVALLVLVGREMEASQELSALRVAASTHRSLRPWLRVLETRNTDDWRVLEDDPTVSLLEQVERFRAMGRTLDTATAIERAGRLEWEYDSLASFRLFQWFRSLFYEDRQTAQHMDWFHVAIENYEGPSDGAYLRGDVLDRERQASEALRRRYDQDRGSLASALNAPGARFFGPSGPAVLGWNTWAGFYQRHVLDHIVKADTYFRRALGIPEQADAYARRADGTFGNLMLHPFVVLRRTAREGVDAEDVKGLPDSIRFTAENPEQVNTSNWHYAQFIARQKAMSVGMPKAQKWFSIDLARNTTFDTGTRFLVLNLYRSVDEAAALLDVAPSNYHNWWRYVDLSGKKIGSLSEMGEEMNRRLEFDLRALRKLSSLAEKLEEDSVPVLERMCNLEPSSCLDLGYRLRDLDRDEEAAVAFQTAVDLAEDTVYVSNNIGWLVRYYYEEGRVEKAREVAMRGASTGSSGGLLTMARLLEDIGELDDAEVYFQRNNRRYEHPAFLVAFYYRQARVEGNSRYEQKLVNALETLFPKGLEEFDAEAVETPPIDGVLINSSSDRLREQGLFSGDIIVALDGFRVRDWDQYETIRAFTRSPEMKLTVWRVNRLLDIEASTPYRRFRVDMKTYERRWSIDR